MGTTFCLFNSTCRTVNATNILQRCGVSLPGSNEQGKILCEVAQNERFRLNIKTYQVTLDSYLRDNLNPFGICFAIVGILKFILGMLLFRHSPFGVHINSSIKRPRVNSWGAAVSTLKKKRTGQKTVLEMMPIDAENYESRRRRISYVS